MFCLLMDILLPLGASILAGLIGWYYGKESAKGAIDSIIYDKEQEFSSLSQASNKQIASLTKENKDIKRGAEELQLQYDIVKERFQKLKLEYEKLSAEKGVDSKSMEGLESLKQENLSLQKLLKDAQRKINNPVKNLDDKAVSKLKAELLEVREQYVNLENKIAAKIEKAGKWRKRYLKAEEKLKRLKKKK